MSTPAERIRDALKSVCSSIPAGRSLRASADAALAALAELERERDRHAEVREIITSVVCGALNRAGINEVDNPGVAIDEIRNRAENAERERDELRAGLERLARLYEDEHDLCDRPMWLKELIARPTRKDGE